MDIFRYKSDAWGQRVLEGASWDLLWIFAGAAVIFIVLHAIHKYRLAKRAVDDD